MISFLAFSLLSEEKCLQGKCLTKKVQFAMHKLYSGRQMPHLFWEAKLKFPGFASHSQFNNNADATSYFTVLDAATERISILN